METWQWLAAIVAGKGVKAVQYVEAVDCGAPEVFVTGISKVERIGPGTIRITMFSRRDNTNVVVMHAVWDLQEFMMWRATLDGAFINQQMMLSADGAPPRGEAH